MGAYILRVSNKTINELDNDEKNMWTIKNK